MSMNPDEIKKVENYMKTKFRNEAINLKKRAQDEDSVEVQLGSEFIGILFKTVEDGETSYDFNMSILDMDLDDMAA